MSTFDNSNFEKYKTEAKEKWGATSAYKEYEENAKNHSEQKQNELAEGMQHIMAEFAICMKNNETHDSVEAQNLVKKLQNYITDNYYHCTNEVLADLTQMYVEDERFKNNIDKFADGTAEFIRKATGFFCSK